MEELLKAKIQKAVNRIIRKDSNIAKDLLEDYKESLVNSTCDIFAALSDVYEDAEEMGKSIDTFVEENIENKDPARKGYQTDGYMVANIPVLIPIECIGMVDTMDDLSLPLVISQLSGYLLRTILALREYDKLGDKFLEKESTMLADVLKEKGWVA